MIYTVHVIIRLGPNLCTLNLKKMSEIDEEIFQIPALHSPIVYHISISARTSAVSF
jgi:hypothetical protein